MVLYFVFKKQNNKVYTNKLIFSSIFFLNEWNIYPDSDDS